MISDLDYLMSLPQMSREIYGYDESDKPNEYCVWADIGYSQYLMAWVEIDEHFRQRIKQRVDSKKET